MCPLTSQEPKTPPKLFIISYSSCEIPKLVHFSKAPLHESLNELFVFKFSAHCNMYLLRGFAQLKFFKISTSGLREYLISFLKNCLQH